MEGQRQAEGWLTRSEVRVARCPACGAAPNEHCKNSRGDKRASNHLERVHERERELEAIEQELGGVG